MNFQSFPVVQKETVRSCKWCQVFLVCFKVPKLKINFIPVLGVWTIITCSHRIWFSSWFSKYSKHFVISVYYFFFCFFFPLMREPLIFSGCYFWANNFHFVLSSSLVVVLNPENVINLYKFLSFNSNSSVYILWTFLFYIRENSIKTQKYTSKDMILIKNYWCIYMVEWATKQFDLILLLLFCVVK